jgi:tetratricopeptide (TPR) repeat protein
MARKRRVFFCDLQPFLKGQSRYFYRSWVTQFLLLITALLCTLGLPVLAKAPAVHPPSLTSSSNAQTQNLVQQGKTFYDAGRFTEAVEVLEQAVSAFQSQGDQLRQAMTLSNLALAYQQLGSLAQANTAITNSLDLLDSLARNTPNANSTQGLLAQTL